MELSKVRRLSFRNKLMILAYVMRSLFEEGMGGILDFQWMVHCEDWLRALGIDVWQSIAQREQDAA